MPITLHLKRQPTVPLEAEVLTPDVLAELSHAEISALTVYHGKRQLPLSEFFDIDGERSADLVIHGDLPKVRWIGRAMSKGSVTVHGSVGMHLGAYMKGGRIEVHGDASDWIGAEMRNGVILIHGNAGGQIGAAYRGALDRMRDGFIEGDGIGGRGISKNMRRGTIVVGGPAKDFVGLQMKGGTILLRSGAEIRTGAWMNRGTIISLKPIPLMPTFTYTSESTPLFLALLAKQLRPFGIALPLSPQEGSYRMYSGDHAVSHKGEILIWNAASA